MTVLESLNACFAWVCGQNLDHTWSPGGILLPLCQRCTGLYAGAAIATLLHLVIRPKLNSRWLELHGAFLLIMVPFGFHWVSQGSVLRAVTGSLFGFAVCTFLWLRPSGSLFTQNEASDGRLTPTLRQLIYALGIMAAIIGIPWMGELGGRTGAAVLVLLSSGGASALAGLVTLNLWLGLTDLFRLALDMARPRKAL